MPRTNEEGWRSRGAAKRPIVYCLIPRELAEKLHDPLREHFADDPNLEVVVERRGDDRRSGADRRGIASKSPNGGERRKVGGHAGRRFGERRVPLTPVVEPPELPRRARRYANRINFVQQIEPPGLKAEDADTARVIAQVQAGDRRAFAIVYTRYFERVYAYLRVAVRDRNEAEDLAQEAFARALEGLSKYKLREQPFRAWLFRIVRNLTLDYMRRSGKVEFHPPEDVERWREESEEGESTAALERIDWITDRDLALFVERLPLPQRQVLFLTYVMDLPTADIAKLLDRSRDDVRLLRSRAQRLLRSRLEAIGRTPVEGQRPIPSWARTRQLTVLRSRRFTLL